MHFNRVPRGWLAGLVFLAVASFNFAATWMNGPVWNWLGRGRGPEFYTLLSDAFLAGQTSLLLKPSAEMLALPDPYDPLRNEGFRLHDASLYHGKYYLYFGPTPALVLFMPYRVLTGSHLPASIAVALFCTGGFAFSCALFFLLVKREQWDCPRWLTSIAMLSLGTAPGIAFLLVRASFYEVAISAGYCFVMAGFLLTAHSLLEDSPRTLSLIGAGLCFGLAAGCRPNLAVLAILMALLVGWRTRSYRVRALGFVAPILLCGLMLAAYNYARFQNPFEFGIQYALLGRRTDLDEHFGHLLGNFPHGIYTLLFSPVHLIRWDMVAGTLWLSPIACLGLLTPCLARLRRIGDHVKLGATRFTIHSLYVSTFSTLILLAVMGFILTRYLVDFAPGFVLLSWCLLAASWQAVRELPRRRQIVIGASIISVALYSLVVELAICVPHLSH